MCGICGYVGRGVSPETVRAMSARIVHRGPDSGGFYFQPGVALANRRLSILDVEGGNQPVFNEAGDIVTVYNGEIYNSPELRDLLIKRGHQFSTHTDTEVLVHLYEDEGESFVRRLEGMFAFALWDGRTRTLMLARDRFGVKPLYYGVTAGHLSFASELGALVEDESLDTEPDREALDIFLELNYIPSPYSIYRSIRKVPPGHTLRWRDGQIRLFRYWMLPDGSEPRKGTLDERELTHELEERLKVAVRRRLLSDVPLGLFLSGGIDSSAVLSFMAPEVSGAVKTFSIGFAERSFSELPAARKVARRFGCDHHELRVEPEAVRDLPRILAHFHEPFGDSSAIPTYHVARLARQHVKVALGGDGGDELFGGYQTYRALRYSRFYDQIPGRPLDGWLGRLINRLPVANGKVPLEYKLKKFREGIAAPLVLRPFAWKTIFTAADRSQLWRDPIDGDPARDLILETNLAYEGADWLNRALYLDTRIYLIDDILVKLDRMTMAHSLEGREPLLDTQLAEFIFSLPGDYKLRGFRGKYLLKKVLESRLPAGILHRSKQGFSIPLGKWLRGPIRSAAEDILLSAPPDFYQFFRREFVESLLRRHQQRKADLSRQIWNLMAVSTWLNEARVARTVEEPIFAGAA